MILDNFDLVNDFNKQIKSKYNSLVYNFFKNPEWIARSIQNKELEYEIIDDVLLLTKKELCGFKRLYYFAPDEARFSAALSKFNMPECVLILDKIGKNISEEDIPVKFKYYGKAKRLTKQINGNSPEKTYRIIADNDLKEFYGIVHASYSDIDDILKMQHSYFNKYIDEYLTERELRAYINNNTVIVSKSDNKITGFYIYSKQGIRIDALYMSVDKNIAKVATGAALIGYIFNIAKDFKFISGWIREDNTYSMNFHTRLGYQIDGYERIFYYHDTPLYPIESLIPLN
jgi:hypothetical protein